jgi:putative addiction module antidote
MTHTLKIRQVGSSLGIILPKEVTGSLNVKEGDMLFFTEGTGGYRVVAHDPDFDKTMKLARDTRRTYRNALRKLAQ